MSWTRFTPAVPRHWLFEISGLMWSAVGLMLCGFAIHWFAQIGGQLALSLAALGLVLALALYRFLFLKIVHKNIARIEQRQEKTCFFAFQAWRSYGLIVVMMALGITLRHSAMPKYCLAVIYTMIGVALFLASLTYHARFRRELRSR
jgi:uncharacterized protein with PQ loop repeat